MNVPVVPKIDVVVAFEVVLFNPVKFCRVDEPFIKIFANVPRPPAVTAPANVIFPPFAVVKKRFDVDAVPV